LYLLLKTTSEDWDRTWHILNNKILQQITRPPQRPKVFSAIAVVPYYVSHKKKEIITDLRPKSTKLSRLPCS